MVSNLNKQKEETAARRWTSIYYCRILKMITPLSTVLYSNISWSLSPHTDLSPGLHLFRPRRRSSSHISSPLTNRGWTCTCHLWYTGPAWRTHTAPTLGQHLPKREKSEQLFILRWSIFKNTHTQRQPANTKDWKSKNHFIFCRRAGYLCWLSGQLLPV